MALAYAEYREGGQFSSDGQLYLNFHVTFLDPDTIQVQLVDIQVIIPAGTSVTEMEDIIADYITQTATDVGFTLDEGGTIFPAYVKR